MPSTLICCFKPLTDNSPFPSNFKNIFLNSYLWILKFGYLACRHVIALFNESLKSLNLTYVLECEGVFVWIRVVRKRSCLQRRWRRTAAGSLQWEVRRSLVAASSSQRFTSTNSLSAQVSALRLVHRTSSSTLGTSFFSRTSQNTITYFIRLCFLSAAHLFKSITCLVLRIAIVFASLFMLF